jgi:hypothetical protein
VKLNCFGVIFLFDSYKTREFSRANLSEGHIR